MYGASRTMVAKLASGLLSWGMFVLCLQELEGRGGDHKLVACSGRKFQGTKDTRRRCGRDGQRKFVHSALWWMGSGWTAARAVGIPDRVGHSRPLRVDVHTMRQAVLLTWVGLSLPTGSFSLLIRFEP